MNWKRVRKERQRVAEDHIVHLYNLALASMDEHPQRAARYISLIRAISKKHKVTLPLSYKRGICKGCNMPLVPGKNASVRIRNATIVISCHECGAVKRYPFRRERKERRTIKSGYFEKKSSGGLVQADIAVSGARIRKISFTGDFFLHPDNALHLLEHSLRNAPIDAVGTIVTNFFDTYQLDMPGVPPEDIIEVIKAAFQSAIEK